MKGQILDNVNQSEVIMIRKLLHHKRKARLLYLEGSVLNSWVLFLI